VYIYIYIYIYIYAGDNRSFPAAVCHYTARSLPGSSVRETLGHVIAKNMRCLPIDAFSAG